MAAPPSFDDTEQLLHGEPTDATGGEHAEKPRILLIDDDSYLLDALTTLLQESYDVLAFASGQAAVEAMAGDVAAVILDVKMPHHDGFWTCDAVRAKAPLVPVIFYSAYQDVKDPYDIMNQHRPFGYITKDESPRVLLETLERAVKYSRTMFELARLVGQLPVALDSAAPPEPNLS